MGAAIVCLILLTSGCSTIERTNWKVIQEDAYHNTFSYDPGSVERTSAGTVTARASSDGSKYRYEIDCNGKKMRILEGHGADPARWIDIVSSSGDQLLYNEVCR